MICVIYVLKEFSLGPCKNGFGFFLDLKICPSFFFKSSKMTEGAISDKLSIANSCKKDGMPNNSSFSTGIQSINYQMDLARKNIKHNCTEGNKFLFHRSWTSRTFHRYFSFFVFI